MLDKDACKTARSISIPDTILQRRRTRRWDERQSTETLLQDTWDGG